MKQKDYYDEQRQDPTSKEDWIEVTLNKNKNSKVYNRNLIQLIPHTATSKKKGKPQVFQTRKKKLQT
jgi:hypothetical protein